MSTVTSNGFHGFGRGLGSFADVRCGSLAEKRVEAIAKAAKVDTRHLPQHQLACLAQLVLNVELLEKDKPKVADSDFKDIGFDSRGQVILHNQRFKTRVRASHQVRDRVLRARPVSQHSRKLTCQCGVTAPIDGGGGQRG